MYTLAASHVRRSENRAIKPDTHEAYVSIYTIKADVLVRIAEEQAVLLGVMA